ncbi:MAG: hypothetical protein WC663_04405 [Patescibacteria group bacterium]|jgi:hypothetical protein
MEKQNQNVKKQDEKKKNSPWILVGSLSCLVLILAFGIMIYFVYRISKESVKKITNNNTAVIENVINESATLPADAIYKNNRYGFSLIYPIGWWHDQSENGDGVMMSPDVNGSGEFNDVADQVAGVVSYGWKNTEGQTIDQFLEQNQAGNSQVFANYKIDKQSDVKLGGLDAKRLDESYQINSETGPLKMKRISIFHLDDKGGLAIIATCPIDLWTKYSVNMDRIIQSYKLDQNIYNAEVGTSVGTSDTDQIMTLARNFVEANSVSGMTFDLNLDKQTDEWARLTAIATGEQKADDATVLLKKENGVWVVVDFGTDLSQWYGETPGGFWD